MDLAGGDYRKCLIIIKFDNLIKKSDIEIKKLYNKSKVGNNKKV